MADGPTLTLGTAEVKIHADLGGLDKGFTRAQEAARKFEAAMQKPTSLVAKHFAKMAQESADAAAKLAKAQTELEKGFNKTTPIINQQSAAFKRIETSIGAVVNRYIGWLAVMRAAQRLAQEAIRTDAEAAAAADRLGEAYKNLAKELGPTMAWLQDRLTDLVTHANNVVKGIKNATEEIGRAPIFGGVGNKLANSPQYGPTTVRSSTFDSNTKNWDVGAGGFPGTGLTDLTEIAAAEKKLMDERQRGYDAEAEAIHALSVARQKMYDDWSNSEEKRQVEFKKGLLDGIRAQAEAGVKQELAREDALERELEQALEYLEKFGEESAAASAKRTEDWIDDQHKAFDDVVEYWEDITHQMDAAGKDFFSEFVATGIANFESLADKMISTWTSTLFDMAKAGNLFGSGSLFGGSGAGLGGILNNVGALVSKWLPVVGAVVGIAQKIFQKKPSDNRAVATFMPGMTDFGFGAQSAYESSDNTLSGVSQAAEAIQKDISALRAAGVTFTQELLNIWLGERDESTFQLSGGGRVSTGSVGDARDLALDALNALLGTATSADPKIAAILKSGGGIEDIQKYLVEAQLAKDFATSITDALLEITDPLEYALTIWERTARANLAMAEQTGFSLDKVREYNAALYQQMIAQQNAGAISAVSGLIGQLQHGDLSAASPGAKFDAGLSEFNKLRDAALSGGAKEAEAFAQFSSGFLPQARDYLGTSVAYGNLQSSTLSTLQSLMTSLTAPQTMPDLTIPLQAGFSMTVGAVEALTNEVKGLRADNQNLSLQIAAMARTVPA